MVEFDGCEEGEGGWFGWDRRAGDPGVHLRHHVEVGEHQGLQLGAAASDTGQVTGRDDGVLNICTCRIYILTYSVYNLSNVSTIWSVYLSTIYL